MRTKRSVLLLLLLFLLFLLLPAGAAWSRGGGGCVEEGTRILTPQGSTAVEHLRPGDEVVSFSEGKFQRARVKALTRVHPEDVIEISADGRRMRLTAEHPVMVGPGEFHHAEALSAGETLYVKGEAGLEATRIESVRRLPTTRPAYNLLVSPGGTFLPAAFVVHNKGCFLPDSPILRSDGTETPISRLKKGDELLAFTHEKRMVRTKIRDIIRHEVDEYVLLQTDRITLRVTPEHPFYVGRGTYRAVEVLKPGDTIYAWDGETISEQRIVSLQKVHERVPVFNLQTDDPNTFFAGRIAVHNKGGGCFPQGTMIATGRGFVPIESLTTGDQVLAVTEDGRAVRTHVKGLFIARNSLFRIKTDDGLLVTTEEHPIASHDGRFLLARDLQPGERILKWKDSRLVPAVVREVSSGESGQLVFNLEVGDPHTFVAENVLVHNKGGGCLPAGTPVRTPGGYVSIEKISPNDALIAIDADRRIITTRVEKVFKTRALILVVETDAGTLRATIDHPVQLASGDFVNAGELRPGQKVLSWDRGTFKESMVLRTYLEGKEQDAYNVSVGWPNTFLASDFVTHNKGGGGSRSSSSGSRGTSSSSSGGDGVTAVIILSAFFSVFILVIIILVWRRKKSKSENLDFVYSRRQIDRKAEKTEKLLSFLARQDQTVAPAELRQRAELTFRKLQECWQARDYTPMKPLLSESLFAQHAAQLQGMVRNHEINRIDDLKVERIDLVNVRYTNKQKDREFTALITASCQDYYVDDRNGSFLRGDTSSARFQEFWTFQHSDHGWILREIEQSGESDVLKDENFVDMLTDETVQGVYGDAAAEGATGPWLEEKTEGKADRIDRLLNFLVQTDKMWNRQRMLERARQVFLSVYLARESGNPDQVPAADLFPEVAQSLQEQIRAWQASGVTVEYRNICVRKVDLILVRNYADRAADEYCVRIYAHAQKITRKNGDVVNQQPYATPFEEYWTMGRLDEEWKLKEVLPSGRARKIVSEENVNEESSAGELQWYYRQTRTR